VQKLGQEHHQEHNEKTQLTATRAV